MMNNKKFVIIGAGGQLGSEFVRTLQSEGAAVYAPDEGSLDLTSRDQLAAAITNVQPDVVINCAAYNAVDDAEDNREVADLINHHAVAALAEICDDRKVRLVHFGSDYVFDGSKGDLYYEEDSVNPLGVYGQSKYDGEQAVLACNCNNLVFRLSWVFGNGKQNFLYKLTNWAKQNKILKVTADEVSVPTYTCDIVTFVLKSLEKDLNGLYHLTNDGYASRYELARFFIEVMGFDNLIIPVPITFFKTKAQRPVFSPMSNKKLSQILDTTMPSWKSGVERFADFIKNI